MKKVLLLGFSVAGGQFYKCAQNSEIPGVQIDLFAIGGHHYVNVPDYLETVISRDNYDMVMVDLLSSECRAWATRQSFTNGLEAILHQIAARNMRVGFTYFYRYDADLETDLLRVVSNEYAARFNIPIIDLGGLIPGIAHEFDRYFIDGVHFTPMGAQWAFDYWKSRLQDPDMWEGDQDFSSIKLSPWYTGRLAMSPSQAGMTGDEVLFPGYGVRWPIMAFGEDQAVTLEMPPGIVGTGCFLSKGPASGSVEVTIEGEAPFVLRVYDSKSYYDHLVWYPIKMGPARRATLRQLPGVPDVKLDKGTPFLGPRVMKVSLVTGKRKRA